MLHANAERPKKLSANFHDVMKSFAHALIYEPTSATAAITPVQHPSIGCNHPISVRVV